MSTFRRPAAAVLALLTFWPALVFGQAQKAGVVTTLEGQVTAARVALPQPVPLKFKDDVFVNDKVVTGDRSIARMLLGGKAIVTVRERSSLTITEVPGRSTIQMDAGKIALAVAREKMRPDELIEIRTPNAVAGVRGTVVIAEIVQSTAQVGPAIAAIVTNFYVLRGAITAVNLNPQTGAPLGPPLSVPVGQSFRAVGIQTPSVQPNPPVPQIVSGLQPSAPAHTQAANQEQVTQAQVQTAVSLLQTLLPAPGAQPETTTTAPTPEQEALAGTTGETTTPATTTTTTTTTAPILPGGSTSLGGTAPTGTTPLLALSGVTGSLGVPPLPDTLQTFSASGSFTANPVVSVTGSSLGQVTAAPMLQVDPGVAVTIPGTLLDVTDSSLMPALHLARVEGTLTQSSGGTLISLDPSPVTTPAGSDLFHIGSSGVVTLAGQLLTDVGGVFDIGRSFVFLGGPGTATLTSTTTAPLIEFSGSQVTTADSFMRIGSGGSVRTGGTLVKATDATGDIGGGAVPGIVVQGPGSGATPNLRAGALLDLVGTNLDLGANPLVAASGGAVVGFTAPSGQGVVNIGGSAAHPNPVLNASALLEGAGDGNTLGLVGTLLRVYNGATATLGTLVEACCTDVVAGSLGAGQPVVSVSGATLQLTGSGGHIVFGASPSQQGFALSSTGTASARSTLNLAGLVVGAGGTNFVDSNALVQLSQTDLLHAGLSGLVEIDATAGPTQIAGQLLTAGANTNITSGSVLFFVRPGGSLTVTGTPTSPLLQFDGGTLSMLGAVVEADGTLALGTRPLLRATGTSLMTNSLLFVDGPGLVSSSASAPLIHVNGGSLADGGSALVVLGAATPGAALDVTGGLLKLENVGTVPVPAAASRLVRVTAGSLSLGGTALEMTDSVLAVAGPLLRLDNGSSFTSTGSAPVVRIVGGSLAASALAEDDGVSTNPISLASTVLDISGGATVTLGAFANVSTPAAFLLPANTPVVNLQGGTLTLTTFDAPLVPYGPGSHLGIALRAASGTTLTLAGPVVDLIGAGLQDLNPIVQLDGGTICTAGAPTCGAGSMDSERSIVNVSAPSTAKGPLFRMTGGTLRSGDAVLGVNADLTVSGAGVGALLQFNGGVVENHAEVAFAENGAVLSLDRGLIDAVNTAFTVGTSPASAFSFVKVWAGSAIAATTSAPLIRIQGGSLTTVNPGTSLVEIGEVAGALARLTLSGGGPLALLKDMGAGAINIGSGTALRVTNGSLSLGGDGLVLDNSMLSLAGPLADFSLQPAGGVTIAGALFLVLNQSRLALNGGPLLRIDGGGTLPHGAGGALVTMDAIGLADGTGNIGTIAGGILDLSNGQLMLRIIGESVPDTDLDDFTFTPGAGQAVVKLSNATLTLTQRGREASAAEFGGEDGATPTIAGTVLHARNSTINIKGPLARLRSFISAATGPLIDLGGLDGVTIDQTQTFESLVRLDANGSTARLVTPLLHANPATIDALGRIVELRNGTIDASAVTNPFIFLGPGESPTSVTSRLDLVRVSNMATVTLGGPLAVFDGLFGSGFIHLADPSFHSQVATGSISGVSSPAGIAVAQDPFGQIPRGHSRLYVASSGNNTLFVLDVDAAPGVFNIAQEASVPVGTGPSRVALNPNETRAYVTNTGGGSVSVVDTSTNTVAATVTGLSSPVGIALDPSGAFAWVVNSGPSSQVRKIDTATNTVVGAAINVGQGASDIVVNRTGTFAYVTNTGSGTVSAINLSTLAVTNIPVGTGPTGIAIMPDGSRLYVANSGSNSVCVIDTSTNTVVATIPVGTNPQLVVVRPDSARVYVANTGSGNVSVIDPFRNVVVGTIPTLGSPFGVAETGNSNRLFVAGGSSLGLVDTNPGGRLLTVERGSTLTSTSTNPLIQLTNGNVTTGRGLVHVEGTLNLQSGLIEASGAMNVTGGGSLIGVGPGGSIVDQAAAPSAQALLRFAGGVHLQSEAFNIVSVSGSPGAPGPNTASITLKRPLFVADGASVQPFFNFLRIADGGSVTGQNATEPFVQFLNGSDYLTGSDSIGPGTGTVLRMFSQAGQAGSSLALNSGFLWANGGSTFDVANSNFVDIRDGATLTASGSQPFLKFEDAEARAAFNFVAIGPGSTSGGAAGTGVAPTVSLGGGLLEVTTAGTPRLFESVNSSFLAIFDGATVTAGPSPLLRLAGSSPAPIDVNAGKSLLFLGATAAGRPAPTLTLGGPLVDAMWTHFTSGDPAANAFSFVFVGDGATLQRADSGGAALLNLADSQVVAAGNIVTLRSSPSSGSPSRLLLGSSGPLIMASNTSFATTSSSFTTNPCCSGVFIGQGAQLTSSAPGALIQLTNSSWDSGSSGIGGGSLFSVAYICSIPICTGFNNTALASTVDLTGGGILAAQDSTVSALFHGIVVWRSSLTAGTDASPVIALTNSGSQTYSFGGLIPASQGGGQAFGSLLFATACPTGPSGCTTPSDPAATLGPATLTFNGPFLDTMNSGAGTRTTFTTTGDFITIRQGATLTSTTTLPFITSRASIFDVGAAAGLEFRHFLLVRDGGGTSGSSPASASFAGPLLSSANDLFKVTAGFVEVNVGTPSATLFLTKSGPTTPVMTLADSVVKLGPSANGILCTICDTGNFLEINANTGMSLSGPDTGLFTVSVTAPSLEPWTVDRLVWVNCGPTAPCTGASGSPGLDTSGSTGPLFVFSGTGSGPHTINHAAFHLKGSGTTGVTEEGNTLTVGTDRPLRHAGTLLALENGASMRANNVAKVDTALLEATAPIIRLASGAALDSQSDGFTLLSGGRIEAAPSDALISLNMATLNVNNGSLFSLAGNSLLKVLGDLVRMSNTSTLNINSVSNGYLLNLTGNAVATISGALFNFQGSGNTVNIANNSAPTTTLTVGGVVIPLFLANGASLSQVSISGTPVKNPANGTINYTNNGSLIRVDGTAARVRVQGL